MTTTLEQIRQMPMGQRMQLVEDIWDTLVPEDANLPLSSEQLMEVETRRTKMVADPSIGIPWTEAKVRILAGSPNVIQFSCATK